LAPLKLVVTLMKAAWAGNTTSAAVSARIFTTGFIVPPCQFFD
jgi:hypothetical protein